MHTAEYPRKRTIVRAIVWSSVIVAEAGWYVWIFATW